MDNIDGTEWTVVIAMLVHLLMAPGTKVEESFNVQATHDLIYHTYNISAYDHNDFPGVVPRTFAGPIYLALFGLPFRFVFYLTQSPKFWMLFAVRFVLGMTVVIAFLNFARAVRKHFGTETAMFLRETSITMIPDGSDGSSQERINSTDSEAMEDLYLPFVV
ncbi:unnamed protein product [Haemonchus placei]|uniref:Mannosyltransferase n=1 Tax=Haemonchus placei TaxID=6290 RepID=A0A0N4X0I4_HAEPC|nr:unnamed protein product [Haemonchus placei]